MEKRFQISKKNLVFFKTIDGVRKFSWKQVYISIHHIKCLHFLRKLRTENKTALKRCFPLIWCRTAASVRTVKFKTTVAVAPVFRCVNRLERRKEVLHNFTLNIRVLKLLFVGFKLLLGMLFFSWLIIHSLVLHEVGGKTSSSRCGEKGIWS